MQLSCIKRIIVDRRSVLFRSAESKAGLFSLVIHAIVFIALFLPLTPEEKTEETQIELISLVKENQGAKVVSPSLKPEAHRAPVDHNVIKTPGTTKLAAPTNPGVTGESDIDSELEGRAPRNSKERYLAEVRQKIASRQSYPRPSRAFGEQGTVKLLLTIQRDGMLTKVELVQGTAFQRLNTAAMTAATEAGPFKEFPEEVQYASWRITLPVHFTLQ